MTTTPTTTLEIGFHHDVEADTYHAWDACSNSRLSRMCGRSPLHLQHELETPEDPTPALILGDAAHLRILQPDLFETRYAISDQCGAQKKDGLRCESNGKFYVDGFWFCGTHKPRGPIPSLRVISRDDGARCRLMRDAVMAHPAARKLLEAEGPIELSGVFVDPATELLCKFRPDKLAVAMGAMVDLKTTDDASPDGFTRSIFKFGYHRQAPFYLDGSDVLGRPFEHFTFIAVEKEPPHAVGVYRLTDDAVDAGREQLKPLMETYARCQESGVWHGYAAEVVDISIPAYAFKQIGVA